MAPDDRAQPGQCLPAERALQHGEVLHAFQGYSGTGRAMI